MNKGKAADSDTSDLSLTPDQHISGWTWFRPALGPLLFKKYRLCLQFIESNVTFSDCLNLNGF